MKENLWNNLKTYINLTLKNAFYPFRCKEQKENHSKKRNGKRKYQLSPLSGDINSKENLHSNELPNQQIQDQLGSTYSNFHNEDHLIRQRNDSEEWSKELAQYEQTYNHIHNKDHYNKERNDSEAASKTLFQYGKTYIIMLYSYVHSCWSSHS